MKQFRFIVLPVILVVACWAILKSVQAAPADGADTSSLVGKPAPDFDLKTLDGKQVKLSDLKGKVTVVDFWATWCPPCRKSLPHIQAVHSNKDLADKGLKVFAVNAREKNDVAQAYLKKNNFSFAVPMDSDGAVMGAYIVNGIPTTVVVGRDGVIKNVFVGFGEGSEKLLDDAITAALAEKAAK